MLAPQWVNLFRVGPWLRRERDKRYYFSCFSNRQYVHGLTRWIILHSAIHVPEESALKHMVVNSDWRPFVIDFRGMDGFFSSFLLEHEYLFARLLETISPSIRLQLDSVLNKPFVAVHIRRGDFQTIGQAIGNEWYLKALDVALADTAPPRGLKKEDLLIRVFTDGDAESVRFISLRPNVVVMPQAPAIFDLLMMSRSLALVGTSRSTFSMWAAFLGQMPSYWHPCAPPPALSIQSNTSAVTIINP